MATKTAAATTTAEQLSAEAREALEYWGYLFRSNKCATDKLDRLLRGIAACISDTFMHHDSDDLTPPQLAAFYRAVGGNYDPLFLQMPPQSIAFIYKSLGCIHSIQPDPKQDGYSAPTIPALKPHGFVTWQTIQLLLGPHEHVPFMQKALQDFDVVDPANGQRFPKILPKEAFPSKPDEHMIAWHEGVSERLRIEAQQLEQVDGRSSGDLSVDGSADEHADAARYFSNPHYRNGEGRPGIVRNPTGTPALLLQGGKKVVRTVQKMVDPYLFSRWQSLPDQTNHRDEASISSGHTSRKHVHYDDDNPSPTGYHHNNSSARLETRRMQTRRHSVDSKRTDSSPHKERTHQESSHHHSSHGTPRQQSPRPQVRRYKSHEPPLSAHEYSRDLKHAAKSTRHARRGSEDSKNANFAPSKSPPFAARIAHIQHPDYFVPQPSFESQRMTQSLHESDHQPSEQYRKMDTAPNVSPRRATDINSSGPRRKYKDTTPVNGVGGRRYPNEAPWS